MLRWIKSYLPGSRDDDEHAAPVRDDPRTSRWAEPGLKGERRRGRSITDAAPVESHPSPHRVQRAPSSDGTVQPTYGPDDGPFQRLVAELRVIVEHPMTWLIVSLFVNGAYAVRRFDRRPK